MIKALMKITHLKNIAVNYCFFCLMTNCVRFFIFILLALTRNGRPVKKLTLTRKVNKTTKIKLLLKFSCVICYHYDDDDTLKQNIFYEEGNVNI